jgi:hypothetical protein
LYEIKIRVLLSGMIFVLTAIKKASETSDAFLGEIRKIYALSSELFLAASLILMLISS